MLPPFLSILQYFSLSVTYRFFEVFLSSITEYLSTDKTNQVDESRILAMHSNSLSPQKRSPLNSLLLSLSLSPSFSPSLFLSYFLSLSLCILFLTDMPLASGEFITSWTMFYPSYVCYQADIRPPVDRLPKRRSWDHTGAPGTILVCRLFVRSQYRPSSH